MRWLFLLAAGCDSVFGVENVGAQIDAPPAAATCLQDDFSGAAVDTNSWQLLDPSSAQMVRIENQQLGITLAPSTNGYNGVESLPTLDFTAGSVQVRVSPAAAASGVETYLGVSAAGRRVVIAARANMLVWSYAFDGGDLHPTPRPIDPTGDAYWRISHAVDRFVFETSPDGATWTSLGAIVHSPAVFDAMIVTLAAGEFDGGQPAPAAAAFDDVRFSNPGCP